MSGGKLHPQRVWRLRARPRRPPEQAVSTRSGSPGAQTRWPTA